MILWLSSLLLAAATDIALENSSWRMHTPEAVNRDGYELHLFESRADCIGSLGGIGGLDEADLEDCVPWVDAQRRELHMAFEVRRGSEPIEMALSADRIAIAIANETGPLPLRESEIEIIPRVPVGFHQLFIVLVDRSLSMYDDKSGDPRIEDVVRALMSGAVKDAFFPKDQVARTGVLLLTFSNDVFLADGRTPWDANPVIITEDVEDYEKQVDLLLYEPLGGYTHLYRSVEAVLEEVMFEERVRGYIQRSQADPALIVITDGFNNERASDRCRDNAEPTDPGRPSLSDVLDKIDRAHTRPGSLGVNLFSIGIGPPYDPEFEPLPGRPRHITPRQLCGNYADERIDDGLENRGIDNPSLIYMARAGGGRYYVGEDPGKVAGLLSGTGSLLHRWFELRLSLDENRWRRFRQKMPLLIEVRKPRHLETRTTFVPHPWMDGPGSWVDSEGVARTPRMSAATGLWLQGLGLSFFLFGAWVALYHAWRAIFRRARALVARRVDPGGSG